MSDPPEACGQTERDAGPHGDELGRAEQEQRPRTETWGPKRDVCPPSAMMTMSLREVGVSALVSGALLRVGIFRPLDLLAGGHGAPPGAGPVGSHSPPRPRLAEEA